MTAIAKYEYVVILQRLQMFSFCLPLISNGFYFVGDWGTRISYDLPFDRIDLPFIFVLIYILKTIIFILYRTFFVF